MSSGPEHEPQASNEQLRRNEWDAHAETPQRIREGFEAFDPDSFALFLQLPDVDPAHPDLLSQYTDRHLGTFTSMNAATTTYLRYVGWVAATSMFLTTSTTEEGRPKWDWERITKNFHVACHVLEDEGRIHVFTR